MRNKVFIAISFDGFIADEHDDLSWLTDMPTPSLVMGGFQNLWNPWMLFSWEERPTKRLLVSELIGRIQKKSLFGQTLLKKSQLTLREKLSSFEVELRT